MNKKLLAELEWIAWEQDLPLDQVIEDFNRTNTHLRDTGSDSLVNMYASDTPGQGRINKTNIIKRIAREKGSSAKVNKRNFEPQLDNHHTHD